MAWHTLEDVEKEAMHCTQCSLHRGRTQVVWMDGNPESDLMFIGEAPGFHEDRQGKPFVGAAGKLLDEMLAEIGLDRTKCTICNVLKCRPPNNRDPMPIEIETCNPFLQAQIKMIKPKVIVTLGNFATRFMLDRQVSISRVRGQKFQIGEAAVIPTFHPAAVLHSGGAQTSPAMKAIRSDFKFIARVLEAAGAPAAGSPVHASSSAVSRPQTPVPASSSGSQTPVPASSSGSQTPVQEPLF